MFSSLPLKNLTLSNRIVVSPMCQYSAQNGMANDWHLVHLGQFAIGKAAAVIQEATAISPEGRITYGDLGIWNDKQMEKYQEISSFISEQGSIPGIQLSHAGRKASTEKPWISREQFPPTHQKGWQTVAPSPIPYHDNELAPYSLSLNEIKEVIEQFKKSAKRAVQSGYKIIEIHAAHGYLIHQFLSPITNFRNDEFGGSFNNRIRFLLEVIDAVKSVLEQSNSLWVRISASDWIEGGWNIEQSTNLAFILKEKGVEVIDVSSGGAAPEQKIPVKPGYQVHFAEKIKKETQIQTATVGLITSAKQANNIIQNNQADIIIIGREFLKNPHLVLHWADELGVEMHWPVQYARAKK